MSNEMTLSIAKDAGFFVDTDGLIWPPVGDNDVTASLYAFQKELAEQCIRTVALHGGGRDKTIDILISKIVSDLEILCDIPARNYDDGANIPIIIIT